MGTAVIRKSLNFIKIKLNSFVNGYPCVACIGRYKIQVAGTYVNGRVTKTQKLLNRGYATCNCASGPPPIDNLNTPYFLPEVLEPLYPPVPEPNPPPDIPVMEIILVPPVPPPTPPRPMVAPPSCPNTPPYINSHP